MAVMVKTFKRFGIHKKLGNTKAMVCTPGLIWGYKGEAVYKWRAMGEGETLR